jgi:hypothetical protein
MFIEILIIIAMKISPGMNIQSVSIMILAMIIIFRVLCIIHDLMSAKF